MAAKLALLSLSILIAIAGIEVVLRVLATMAPEVKPLDHVSDPALMGLPIIRGMKPLYEPNQRAVFKGRYYRTNSDGIRGREYEIPKPENTFRVLVIGDSVTMGSGVDEDETYTALLERQLGTQFDDVNVETVNLGIGGFNLTSSLFRLRDHGIKYEPDLIVYGWTHNDLEGVMYIKSLVRRGPLKSGLLLEGWLRDRLSSVRDIVAPAPDSYIGELSLNYFRNPAAWQKFTSGLDELAEISEEEGVCVVVLLHTALYSLHAFHPFRPFYDAVERASTDRGFYVATTFERFKARTAERLWIHPEDSHPNSDGHQILADALYEKVRALPVSCFAVARSRSDLHCSTRAPRGSVGGRDGISDALDTCAGPMRSRGALRSSR